MKPQLPFLFKELIKVWLDLFLVFIAFASKIIDEVKLVAETNHSTIAFSVPVSNGLNRITGKFADFSIDVNYVDKDITKSNISATVNISSINTGIPARDEDLKTKDFFETDKYPQATFLSDSICKVADGFMAYGKFVMLRTQ